MGGSEIKYCYYKGSILYVTQTKTLGEKKVVTLYESGNMSIIEVTHRGNVTTSTVQYLIRQYRRDGRDCFVESKQKRVYGPKSSRWSYLFAKKVWDKSVSYSEFP